MKGIYFLFLPVQLWAVKHANQPLELLLLLFFIAFDILDIHAFCSKLM